MMLTHVHPKMLYLLWLLVYMYCTACMHFTYVTGDDAVSFLEVIAAMTAAHFRVVSVIERTVCRQSGLAWSFNNHDAFWTDQQNQ